MSSILCVGLVCIDKFLVVKSFPEEDSDQLALEVFKSRGGNANNNCTVLCQILDPIQDKVTFLGVFPNDATDTQFVLDDLDKHGITISQHCQFRPGSIWPEGTVILSQDTGSRTIIFNPGTLEPLTANEFTKVFESNELIFDWIHFEARPNIEDMIRFLQESKMKAKISIEIEKTNMGYENLIGEADVVIIGKDVSKANHANNPIEAIDIFKTKLRTGAILICTWGDKGASGVDQDGQVHHVQAVHQDHVIDTLGAGDTFTATVIASLIRGHSLLRTLKLACHVAGTKVGQRGFKNLGSAYQKALYETA